MLICQLIKFSVQTDFYHFLKYSLHGIPIGFIKFSIKEQFCTPFKFKLKQWFLNIDSTL